MIKYFIIIILPSINDDGFYIYVHRSLEDTLNMNICLIFERPQIQRSGILIEVFMVFSSLPRHM
jgi:hypothetical protein